MKDEYNRVLECPLCKNRNLRQEVFYEIGSLIPIYLFYCDKCQKAWLKKDLRAIPTVREFNPSRRDSLE